MDNFDHQEKQVMTESGGEQENRDRQPVQTEMVQEEPTYEEPERPMHHEQRVVEPSRRRSEDNGHRRPSGMSYLAVGLIGAVIGGSIVAAAAPRYFYSRLTPPQTDYAQIGQNIVINPTVNITVASAVAQKVTPTVVRISTVTVERDLFFGKRSYEGVGSGVVIDPNGYILTNAHVVGEHPEELKVFFKDGKELDGEVLWKDTLLDLAVVKVKAANLPAAELGDSDKLIVGETTIAIGNPLGMRFERTVTQGIVSGLNRSIMIEEGAVMEDLIQTDAAINPGNSGGPLMNSQGQVIGINTVKASAEGLGFAIPINISKPITKKLIEKGAFIPTYMGITPLDSEMLGYYETEIEIQKGIYVYNVSRGTPAEKAGLRAKDIITYIDDEEVNTLVKFKSVLYNREPGDVIRVRYTRGGSENTAEITLIAMPEEFR